MSSDTTIYPVFPEQMIRAVKTYFLNNFTHEKAAHDKKYTLLVNYGHVLFTQKPLRGWKMTRNLNPAYFTYS